MKRIYALCLTILICQTTCWNIFAGTQKQLLVTGGMLGISRYLHTQAPLTQFNPWNKPTRFLQIHEPEIVPTPYLIGGEFLLAGILTGTLQNLSRTRSAVTLLQLQATVSVETQLAKWFFGRHRPDYRDREKRFQDWLNRTPPDTPEWEMQYRKWQKLLNDGRRSFWSGHASNATSAMTFLGFLLWNDRTTWSRSGRYSALSSLSGLAGFVAASRVADNRHHLSDTLTGSLAGVLNAVLFYKLYFDVWPYSNTSRPEQVLASQVFGYFSSFVLTRILF